MDDIAVSRCRTCGVKITFAPSEIYPEGARWWGVTTGRYSCMVNGRDSRFKHAPAIPDLANPVAVDEWLNA